MPKPNPVIILPGYYGTLLVDQAANKPVWLTLGSLFESGEVLDAINLETGDPDRIVAGGVLEEFHILGRWAPNFYKGLQLFLGALGFAPEEVIPFGIDWRRTLGFNVDQLQDRIRRAGRVNIIAHSHGGLVAREYLRKHGGDLVDHFITLGTPHKGLLDTMEAMTQGIDFFKWSKSHLMKTARTFPSAYEVLPADPLDGFFEWNKNKNADPFTQTAWADASMKPKLADAAAVVAGLPRTLPVKTAIIYGTHRDTTARAVGATGKKLTFKKLPAGDGTVPSVSASGSGLSGAIERYAIPYGVHSHLFDHPAAQRVMKNILFDRPMPYFTTGFSREMYMTGEPLGIGVDVRGPGGEVLADADVRINLNGRDIAIPRDEKSGDYFVQIDEMPKSPQHLQYKITARSAALSQPLSEVSVLHPLNN
jgi:pimeloyl-ACP methyl ester carboxylesterase